MKTSVTLNSLDVTNLGTLSELLDLLAKLSKLSAPLNTPDGLRGAIDLLLRLGSLVGLDSDWLDWLRGILEDQAVFNLVLAVLNYALSVIEPPQAGSMSDLSHNSGTKLTTQAIPIAVWLSLFAEIAQLLQKLRAKS